MELLDNFPAEINQIYDSKYFVINQPITKPLESKLKQLDKKYLNEIEILKASILKCKKCGKTYTDASNDDSGCKFHPEGTKMITEQYYNETHEYLGYKCCGKGNGSEGCKSEKHSQ